MRYLTKHGVGGAEVEISLMFADIRGSTALGEQGPTTPDPSGPMAIGPMGP